MYIRGADGRHADLGTKGNHVRSRSRTNWSHRYKPLGVPVSCCTQPLWALLNFPSRTTRRKTR